MCCGYSRAQTAVIHSLHEHPLRTDCVPGHEDTNMKMTQCKPSRSAQPAWRCGRGGDELHCASNKQTDGGVPMCQPLHWVSNRTQEGEGRPRQRGQQLHRAVEA